MPHAELKLLYTGATCYCHAVDKTVDIRARQLPKSYVDKAKHLERVYYGVAEGKIGLVQQRLQEFSYHGCFVVGHFAEVVRDPPSSTIFW